MSISEPTGPRPRPEAGKRPRKLAITLSRVKTRDAAADWLVAYNQWEQAFAGFLDEQSRWTDGSTEDTHQRLFKARRMIRKRIREQHPSAFLDDTLTRDGPIPATNNLIESRNARLRDMMRRHRGEHPQPTAWPADNAITGQHIEEPYGQAW